MFRGVTTMSRVIPTHASPTIRSRRLLRGAVKIETFVVSSLNYRLTFISRDVVSIFLLLFFFVRKLEKASKKKNLLFFFFLALNIFPTRKRSVDRHRNRIRADFANTTQ